MTATLGTDPPGTEPVVAAVGVRVLRARPRSRTDRDPEPQRILGGVDLEVPAGATVGILAERGSGAGALLRVLAGRDDVDAGHVRIAGHELDSLDRHQRSGVHQLVTFIDHDVRATFDARHSIGRALRNVLADHGVPRRRRRERLDTLAAQVGIGRGMLDARPAELGDEAILRAGLARGLALDPEVVVLDDPFRQLDHAARLRLVRILERLHHDGVSIVVSSADPTWLARTCDYVAVLAAGRIVEAGNAATVLNAPRNPLTRMLCGLDDAWAAPPRSAPVGGCVLADRCPRARDRCHSAEPSLQDVMQRHLACHFAETILPEPDQARPLNG